ncbi:MAG: CoA-binding protein [bacterium]
MKLSSEEIKNKKKETVLIIGASNKTERYSNMAQKVLLKDGHKVMLFNPAIKEIEGIKVINDMKDIKGEIETITLYVGPTRLVPMIDDIIKLNSKRIIANPGTECEDMRRACELAKIEYIEACTLVMLSTGQF